MVRPGRLDGWRLVLIAYLLLAIVAAAGISVALEPRGPVRPDGFLAHGRVSVTIAGNILNTPRTKRCMANSVEAGIDVRQGTPVVISLDGNAVGGGNLSTGQLVQEMTRRGNSESSRASCQYKFSAPVTRPGEGRYTVDIGGAKIAFSRDDLRNGINLALS